MKTTIKLFLLISLFFASGQISAQQSVIDAKENAEKLTKKIKKRRFNKFKEAYPKALKEIAKIEAEASQSEFGYDKVADKIGNWIKLNSYIKKLGSEVVYKDESVKLQYKDYKPLREEARKKASKAHYDAAIKIIETSKDYKERGAALKHFDKCFKYDYVKEYTEKVKEQRALVYYEEGVRILTTSKTFVEKEKCTSLFSKARTQIKDYKDTKELVAKMYFDEAVKLSKSSELEKLYLANKYFKSANKSVENYKDCQKLRADLVNKIAGKQYQEGLKAEKILTFESQKKAAEWFNLAEKWLENYKDAADRAEKANVLSKVNVLLVEKNGKLIIDTRTNLNYNLTNKTKKYISFPNAASEVKAIDMNKAANYLQAQKTLAYGFIVVKMGKSTTKFSKTAPATTSEKYDLYFMTEKKTGKKSRITKLVYNVAVASDKAEDEKLYTYNKYNGKVTTVTATSKLIVNYVLEIWDVRNTSKAIKLGVFNYNKTFTDTNIKETFAGDAGATPTKMRYDKSSLKNEQELIKQSITNAPSVQGTITENLATFAKLLDSKVKFKKYNVPSNKETFFKNNKAKTFQFASESMVSRYEGTAKVTSIKGNIITLTTVSTGISPRTGKEETKTNDMKLEFLKGQYHIARTSDYPQVGGLDETGKRLTISGDQSGITFELP